MDGLDETLEHARPARIFAVGLALGGVFGLLVGSAIGIAVGERTARALRHLLEDVLRRSDRVDFELLAQ